MPPTPEPPARPAGRSADGLVRSLVAEHTGTDAAGVRVGRLCGRCGSSQHGRPHAHLAGGGRVWVSLARSAELVLAAVCDEAPVGVDLEAWGSFPRPGHDAATLHARESPGDAAAQALTWVRKESLLKAVGLGLSVDPRAVRLTPASAPPALVSWHGPGDAPVVAMRDLDVPGHAACVTVMAAPEPRVSLRWAAAAGPPGPATPPAAR